LNIKLSQREFSLFKELIYAEFGISLSEKKIALVQSRLHKWVKALELNSFKELYEHVVANPHELVLLADAITTNVTSFFREENQWIFLEKFIPKNYSHTKKIRIWSAACSTGQEPYTIAMFLHEILPDIKSWDIKILATDLSHEVLRKAKKGEYKKKDLEGMPKKLLNKYFIKHSLDSYIIKNELKNMILFRSFNLVAGDYKIFKNPIDLIFCRNVMIYFNKHTQLELINRLFNLISSSGLLLIGHSESIAHKDNRLVPIAPSIYQKRGF